MANGIATLLHRNAHAADIGVDLQADLAACQFELGALVVGHDDHLGSLADRATAAGCTVDPAHILGAADMARGALEIGLGGTEGEAAGNAADRDGIVTTMEGQRAFASGTTDKEGRLVDGEADRAAIGMRGTGKTNSRGGDDGNRS